MVPPLKSYKVRHKSRPEMELMHFFLCFYTKANIEVDGKLFTEDI